MSILRISLLIVVATVGSGHKASGEELVQLRGEKLVATVAVNGGAVVGLQLNGSKINPINWEVAGDLETAVEKGAAPRGQFLCLDRWGAPSAAEGKNGMPFHGEASMRRWKVTQPSKQNDGIWRAEMECDLPLGGLRVNRKLELENHGTVLRITERVTNTRGLGRVYNMVQHPTIAPPFLDEFTLIDSNADLGFSQDSDVPAAGPDSSRWPRMKVRGQETDLRRLEVDKGSMAVSDVSSFVFSPHVSAGWVTASNPKQKLLLGYWWNTKEYPWLNIWRFREGERRLARGLEFGTTGYHQPFPTLVKTGPILGNPTYDFLDADESHERSYLSFVVVIPEDFLGVETIEKTMTALQIRERRASLPRTIEVPTKLTEKK